MRIFLITFGVSILSTIGLWNFGLARMIWPSHPLLATTVLATICGIVTQELLRADAVRQRAGK